MVVVSYSAMIKWFTLELLRDATGLLNCYISGRRRRTLIRLARRGGKSGKGSESDSAELAWKRAELRMGLSVVVLSFALWPRERVYFIQISQMKVKP